MTSYLFPLCLHAHITFRLFEHSPAHADGHRGFKGMPQTAQGTSYHCAGGNRTHWLFSAASSGLVLPCSLQNSVPDSQNPRMVWAGNDLKAYLIPYMGQGHLPLDEVASSSIQPGCIFTATLHSINPAENT